MIVVDMEELLSVFMDSDRRRTIVITKIVGYVEGFVKFFVGFGDSGW